MLTFAATLGRAGTLNRRKRLRHRGIPGLHHQAIFARVVHHSLEKCVPHQRLAVEQFYQIVRLDAAVACVSRDLAGYRVLYGTSAGALTQTVDLANPGVATYVVTGLSSGSWFFAVKAYNSGGAESANSSVVSKTIP